MAKVKGTTGKLKMSDGQSLFYRRWAGQAKKPVLLFVHGMGEHSGRYSHPIKYFTEQGFTVYAYDQRGHGRTPGRRAYVDRFTTLLGDLDHVIKFIEKKEPRKQVFLIGHSFGGQVSLTYAARHGNGLAGLIVSSPNIRLAMPVAALKKRLGLHLARIIPTLLLDADLKPELVSRDLKEVAAYANDDLINQKISVRLASEMFANQDILPGLAPDVDLPCLLMHAGDDQISDPKATKAFYKNCGSKDKSLKVYPGLYHELFNEIDRNTVFADMHKWLKARMA